jgi:hypothetical protein
LIDWCLTPTLAVFQLYLGVSVLHCTITRSYTCIITRDCIKYYF